MLRLLLLLWSARVEEDAGSSPPITYPQVVLEDGTNMHD